ncbi:lipopolysaccharide biosynthesis protein [Flexibacterium corallicola]|uniref:lipopolysaccharide biosynthesis protein n=1 Tax=Flexibacterium corallicola TaxID=3037259 RepID=UPI00286F6334|nr:lipopolysaccharide biosynthesis protein [Pseudovibrio sp. M1P-2-3]
MALNGIFKAWPYIASIVLTKGLSVVTIPVLTGYMKPEDVGYLDVIASIVEFIGLICALGLADTLFRFSGTQSSEAERNKETAAITGSALLITFILGSAVQLFLPLIVSAWNLPVNIYALRLSVLGATLAGLIELPLAWLRLGNRPLWFFFFTASRGILQAIAMVAFLMNGYGLDAILAANGTLDIILTASLLFLQIKKSGAHLSRKGFQRTFHFGLPLVGGALAMFALGSCDRWFLVTAITPETLAHYSIAVKLALAAPILLQPFGLWWHAKRIGVLEQKNGLAFSADATLLGFWILIIGALGTALTAPIFIIWFLPESYTPAIAYIPWLILCFSMNELCSLFNVGSYRARHGFYVLIVNTVGGGTAIAGYALLVSSYGVAGAIVATLLGQSVRFTLFISFFHRRAPIPYRLGFMSIFTLLAVTAIVLQPAYSTLPIQFAYAIAWGLIMLGAGLGVAFKIKGRHVFSLSGVGT